MPRDQRRLQRSRRVRALLFAVALVLGTVAIILIVTGTTQKSTEIGVLVGLWGLLIAYFTGGPRRGQPAPAPAPAVASSADLELRRSRELVPERTVAERREFELRLEQMLRREQAGLLEEVAALREEVLGLRKDVVDKVGGQLRLERIETTRVIGSDIEALQHEVRRLAINRQDFDHVSGPLPALVPQVVHEVSPVSPPPSPRPTEAVPAPIVVARAADETAVLPIVREVPVDAEPAPLAEAPTAVQSPLTADRPADVSRPADVPRPGDEPQPADVPQPAAASESDPFAGLPRLTRFVYDEPEPASEVNGHGAHEAPPGGPGPSASSGGGGRRRRAENEPNEILERLLGR